MTDFALQEGRGRFFPKGGSSLPLGGEGPRPEGRTGFPPITYSKHTESDTGTISDCICLRVGVPLNAPPCPFWLVFGCGSRSRKGEA